MGKIGKSLVSQIRKIDEDGTLREFANKYHGVGVNPERIQAINDNIKDGIDPHHAVYASIQNLTSMFAERVSVLPKLKPYYNIMEPAEEEYMPSGPPMSPLTGSYFTNWAFFDCRFGVDKETIGTCLLDVNEAIGFSPDMRVILEIMQNSRMGIYEHLGLQGDKVLLQDIMTQEKHLCYVPAGYMGENGQCWLARILPPVNEYFDYSILFNTPYILMGESKEDWIAFFKRTMLGAGDKIGSHAELMKYGLDTHYWNEYIFQAYHHHQKEAIFLTGLPDVRDSLPHASERNIISIDPQERMRKRKPRLNKKGKRR